MLQLSRQSAQSSPSVFVRYDKIKKLFESRNAKTVRICTMLDKPSRRVVDVSVDYVGKEIPDEFVVGYGLDYNEQYRNFPFVGVLKRSVYEK